MRDAYSRECFAYPATAKTEGLVSVISAPISFGKQIIGILPACSEVKRDFIADEYAFIQGIATISAIAVKNARMLKLTGIFPES